MQIIGLFLALLIGLILGLVGGGGTILTVPLVQYLFNKPTYEATTYSLIVVTFAALFGVMQRLNQKLFAIREAIIFVIPSMIVAFSIRLLEIPEVIALWGKLFSRDELISFLLVIVMIYIALRMLLPKPKIETLKSEKPNTLKIIFMGILTGVLSGFLGAGGGFIIVPILVSLGLEMKKAIATSMLIVTIQSAVALSGDYINKISTGGLNIDYTLVLWLTILTIIGVFVGTRFQRKVTGLFLRRMFASVLIIVAVGIVIDHLVQKM